MVVLHYIASSFWGGGEQYVYDLSMAIRAQYQVRSIFVCQPGTPDDLIACWQAIGKVYFLYPETKNGKFSFIEAMRLARILQREQVDVVHVHELKDFFICAYAKRFCARKVRLVATRHIIGEAKSKASWLWVYRQIDAIVFNSQLTADTFLSKPAVKRALLHTYVVRNSIVVADTEDTWPILREQYGIASTLPLVMYHGRICREKGIVQLLQALAPSFQGDYAVVLAGFISDDIRGELDGLLHHSSMAGYIHPIGFRRDISQLIPQCTIGVLPSVVPEAGGPLTLLEQMAMGGAIIASDNGSQPEYVQNGTEAILLPPGNWGLWREAIERLLQNPSLAGKMGENAKQRFLSDFTYTRFIDQIYSIYVDKED